MSKTIEFMNKSFGKFVHIFELYGKHAIESAAFRAASINLWIWTDADARSFVTFDAKSLKEEMLCRRKMIENKRDGNEHMKSSSFARMKNNTKKDEKKEEEQTVI